MKHDNIGYLLIILIIILVFLLVYRQENVEYFQDNNKNIYGESDYYTMYSKLFKK